MHPLSQTPHSHRLPSPPQRLQARGACFARGECIYPVGRLPAVLLFDTMDIWETAGFMAGRDRSMNAIRGCQGISYIADSMLQSVAPRRIGHDFL